MIVVGPYVPRFDDMTGFFKSGLRTHHDSFAISNDDDEDDDNYPSKIESSFESEDESSDPDEKQNYPAESKKYERNKRTSRRSTPSNYINLSSVVSKLHGENSLS